MKFRLQSDDEDDNRGIFNTDDEENNIPDIQEHELANAVLEFWDYEL